jgi:hypothetical protein
MSDSSEAAEADFGEAERILREASLPFWLAVVQVEHAEARMIHGGDAAGLAEEARETFARLRATPWLARAEAIAAPAVTAGAASAGTPRPTA